MDWWIWLIIVAVVVLAIGVLVASRRPTLRERFGPEYDRALDQADSERAAKRDLRGRLKQHRKLELEPLSKQDAQDFAQRWFVVQSKFVDDPRGACQEAGALIDQVLRRRGYPVDEDFDTQADLVSVDHPNLVADYRTAHEATERGLSGPSGTEELRTAFVAYRNLFAQVLDQQADTPTGGDDDHEIDLTESPTSERTAPGGEDTPHTEAEVEAGERSGRRG